MNRIEFVIATAIVLLVVFEVGPPFVAIVLAYVAGLGLIAIAHELARRDERLSEELRREGERAQREIEELSTGLGEWIWECDSKGRLTYCGPAVTSVQRS